MTHPASASATVRAAAAGVSAHILWQVTARLASFAIKAVVVRALGPAQFAFVEIRLGLLVSLALLPAIGAFRKVCLRSPNDSAAAALAYVCVFVTLSVSSLLGGMALYRDHENYASWMVVTASLLVRAFAEPPLVFARRRERYGESSRARAMATVMSGFGQTLAVSMVADEKLAKPASAMGHLFYSCFLGAGMYYASGPGRVPLLSFSQFSSVLLKADLAMVGVALGQATLKFLLENGEGIVLDLTCSAPVKGAYKLAGNFASIIARFFSEALEEQSFNVFHRLAPAFRQSVRGEEERGEDMRQTCISTLTMAVKAAITVSILIALVGPAYSYAVLRLLYGEQWADRTPAPILLNQYFVYLVFMAGNGVSEAFVSAAASTSELKLQTQFTTVLSTVYIVALFYAARTHEATGIIVVNCINMFARTCYSTWFYTKLTGRSVTTLMAVLPHPGVIAVLLFARQMSFTSEQFFLYSNLKQWAFPERFDLLGRVALHGISGVVSLVLFAASLWIFERKFLKQVVSLRSHQD